MFSRHMLLGPSVDIALLCASVIYRGKIGHSSVVSFYQPFLGTLKKLSQIGSRAGTRGGAGAVQCGPGGLWPQGLSHWTLFLL